MTAEQLAIRLSWIENLMAKERDTKSLAMLNATYQKILDRLVELDLAAENEKGKR